MKRSNPKTKLYAAISVVVLLVVAAFSWLQSKPNKKEETASSSASAKSAESHITFGFGGDPVSINPINSNDFWGLRTINLIYTPLVRTNNDGTVTNELATDVQQSEDGKSITVKLKEDVRWSDGEEFNADDVVFTYTQKAKKENGKYESLWVGNQPPVVKKINNFTVQFDLAVPSAAAVNNITNETYIIPEHLYGDVADLSIKDLGVYPTVGTGPYVLEKFSSGEKLEFRANPYYHRGTVGIEKITAPIISNSDTLKVALQSGEVDGALLTAADVPDVKDSDVTTYAYSSGSINYFGINSEIISDQRIRQAIFYALNRGEIHKALYASDDYYLSAYSFLPADNAYHAAETPEYKQDLEKAKALLKEANASDLTFSLAYDATNDTFQKQAAIIQEQLAKVGITVQLEAGDGDTILAELKSEGTTKYPLFLRTYSMGNDPDTYKRLFQTGGASNYFKLANDKVDGYFASGGAELDKEKRQEIYKQLQTELANEAVIYPVESPKGILVFNNRVTGIDVKNLYPIYIFGDWGTLSLK